jgi:D-alanine-D-alanine ligase
MSGKRPSAAVLYNPPTLPHDHRDHASEADVVAVAGAIASILVEGGFEAWLQPAAPPLLDLIGELTNTAPDLVFNLIEGFDGDSSAESHVTAMLELLRIPYTGCPPDAQSLCHDKGKTKALLSGFGLPTAPFVVATTDEEIVLSFDGPYFVKPDAQDASLGIDQGSVIVDRASLVARVALLRREYGPRVLIEAYLPGPEFNVGVLALPDPVALTTAEVTYANRPGKWPILTYDAKWDVGSAEDLASPIRCPADLDTGLDQRLGDLAVTAFVATGCRDYARVDFRLDTIGNPMILEVNPNPDLGPTAGWARALCASGRDYGPTIVALARQAMAKGPWHV